MGAVSLDGVELVHFHLPFIPDEYLKYIKKCFDLFDQTFILFNEECYFFLSLPRAFSQRGDAREVGDHRQRCRVLPLHHDLILSHVHLLLLAPSYHLRLLPGLQRQFAEFVLPHRPHHSYPLLQHIFFQQVQASVEIVTRYLVTGHPLCILHLRRLFGRCHDSTVLYWQHHRLTPDHLPSQGSQHPHFEVKASWLSS